MDYMFTNRFGSHRFTGDTNQHLARKEAEDKFGHDPDAELWLKIPAPEPAASQRQPETATGE